MNRRGCSFVVSTGTLSVYKFFCGNLSPSIASVQRQQVLSQAERWQQGSWRLVGCELFFQCPCLNVSPKVSFFIKSRKPFEKLQSGAQFPIVRATCPWHFPANLRLLSLGPGYRQTPFLLARSVSREALSPQTERGSNWPCH